MATLSKGYSFGATETVTNAKLSSLVDSATISGIVNADCAAGMALASSKVNYTGSGIPTVGATQTWTGTNTFSGNIIEGTANQGDIWYDDGTKMTRLTPGTSGYFLKTQGTGANPKWDTLTETTLQVVTTTYNTYASLGTTAIPVDDTKPTWAEGDEISGLQTTITPLSATSELIIDVTVHLSAATSGAEEEIVTMFKNGSGTDECIAVGVSISDSAGTPMTISFTYSEVSGDTTLRTYDFRAGNRDGDNTVINGKASATAGRIFGGALVSSVTITEVVV